MQEKLDLIDKILEKEWKLFSKLNNIGGRASCQDNQEEFFLMRKAWWQTFNFETLSSYFKDLSSEYANPLYQKYGYMMKYNMPNEYEKIKFSLKELNKEKINLVNKIMKIYMKWEEEFFEKFPLYSTMGRPLYTNSDDMEDTSIETYLRGELSSYSQKTLTLFFNYIKKIDKNLAIENMDYLAQMQGFKNCIDVEKYYKNLK